MKDHFAKDCPNNLRRKPRRHTPDAQPAPEESMDTATPGPDISANEMPNPEEPNPTEEEIESNEILEEFLDDLLANESSKTAEDCPVASTSVDTPKEKSELVFQVKSWVDVSVQDKNNQSTEANVQRSQAWADLSEEKSSNANSEKLQEAPKSFLEETQGKPREKPQVKPKIIYCFTCRVDSHSEEQCGKVVIAKQSTKRKLGRRNSKPSKGESAGKKCKSFHRFKGDLESIVLRGKSNTD